MALVELEEFLIQIGNFTRTDDMTVRQALECIGLDVEESIVVAQLDASGLDETELISKGTVLALAISIRSAAQVVKEEKTQIEGASGTEAGDEATSTGEEDLILRSGGAEEIEISLIEPCMEERASLLQKWDSLSGELQLGLHRK